uniref:RdRp n=1 Tax=Entomophthora narnavirus A TaxID=2592620 RepID=A0A7G3KIP4_9VIRU|nr:RdRp [Entomophthora narnavirus A]
MGSSKKTARETHVSNVSLHALLRNPRVGGSWSKDVSLYLAPARRSGVQGESGERGLPSRTGLATHANLEHRGASRRGQGHAKRGPEPRRKAPKGGYTRQRVCWSREFKSSGRKLEAGWNALTAALAACHPAALRFDLSVRADRDRVGALKRLAVACVRRLDRGVGELMAELKSLATTFRTASIRQVPYSWDTCPAGLRRHLEAALRGFRLTTETLDQLSFLGRALPPGDSTVEERALRVHRDVITSDPAPIPPGILKAAEAFACTWALTYLHRGGRLAHPKTMESSTITSRRREGGVAADLCMKSMDLDPLPETVQAEVRRQVLELEGPLPSECDLSAAFRTTALRDWAVTTLTEPGYVPTHKVLPIPEAGWKCRIATVPELPASVAGGLCRSYLLPALRRTPECADVLRGEEDKAARRVAASRRPIEGDWIVSSDLTAASDTLAFGLLQALVRGLALSGRLPPWVVRSLEVLVGPQRLTYPDGETVITARGTLMGLGHTWSLLSLSHLFWLEAAHASVPRPVSEQVRLTAAVCGDDLVVRAPLGWIRRYEEVASLTGAQFSQTKHFVAKRRFVFLEELYTLRGTQQAASTVLGPTSRGGRLVRAWPAPGTRPPKVRVTRLRTYASGTVKSTAIPLAGLVAGDVMTHQVMADSVPLWSKIGLAVESLASTRERALRVRRVTRHLYPALPSWLLRHGIRPTLPRALGGGGLLPNSGNCMRLGRLPRRVAKMVTAVTVGRCPRTAARLSRIYLPLSRRATNFAEAKVHTDIRFKRVGAVLSRSGREPWNGKGVRLGTLTEAPEQAALAIARELSMVLLPEPKKGGSSHNAALSPFQVGKQFLLALTKALRRWPGAKPVSARAPRKSVSDRTRAVEEAFVWWAPSHRIPEEGFGGWGLAPAAQRVLKDSLGWSAPSP